MANETLYAIRLASGQIWEGFDGAANVWRKAEAERQLRLYGPPWLSHLTGATVVPVTLVERAE